MSIYKIWETVSQYEIVVRLKGNKVKVNVLPRVFHKILPFYEKPFGVVFPNNRAIVQNFCLFQFITNVEID